MKNIRKLGQTHISISMPWGLNSRNGHKMMCFDGKIRAVELAQTADTFFSTPARCRVDGRWVSGYATTEKNHNWEKSVYVFRHHDGQGLPEFPKDKELEKLVENCV